MVSPEERIPGVWQVIKFLPHGNGLVDFCPLKGWMISVHARSDRVGHPANYAEEFLAKKTTRLGGVETLVTARTILAVQVPTLGAVLQLPWSGLGGSLLFNAP